MSRPRPIPHADGAAPTPRALESWLAARLHARHRGEPVRTLEALATALANRLALAGIRGTPRPAPPEPPDRSFAVCRRVARRALAGGACRAVGRASRYHHESVDPAWARGAVPSAHLGGFLFYTPEGDPR